MNENKLLVEICREGWTKKIKGKVEDEKLYSERIKHELSVIQKLEFSSYFLIVWDFVRWARDKKIRVGAGRGSAAGSLVSYLADITRVDPLKHGLLFERFLNEGRIALPDIDLDFQDTRRNEVTQYLRDKYGDDKVAVVVTYNVTKGKGVIRDTARVLNIPIEEVNKISKLMGYDDSLEECLETNKKMREYQEIYPELFEIALKIQGAIRSVSQHAAGVVVTPKPLIEMMPVCIGNAGVTTQFDKNDLEELGFCKVDLLSLKTLTVIQETIDLIEESTGKEVPIDDLELEDREIYKMLQQGDTTGLFQFETDLNKKLLREIKPDDFEELVACVSLGRPGAKEGIVYYVDGKFNGNVVSLHPLIDDILKETYGCIIYQEQSMKIAQQLAGFSLNEADVLRKIIGKSQEGKMEKYRERWMKGCRENKVDDKTAKDIFEIIQQSEHYSFNKSHATVYGLIAYQTAWLKCYYPKEYMSILLSNTDDLDYKLPMYIKDCQKHEIQVLPVDINSSKRKFVVDGESIRHGFGVLKGVGLGAIGEVVSKQPYNSFEDFIKRINRSLVRKTAIVSLIDSGAFEGLGATKEEMKNYLEKGVKDPMKSVNLFEETDEIKF